MLLHSCLFQFSAWMGSSSNYSELNLSVVCSLADIYSELDLSSGSGSRDLQTVAVDTCLSQIISLENQYPVDIYLSC